MEGKKVLPWEETKGGGLAPLLLCPVAVGGSGGPFLFLMHKARLLGVP